MFTGYGAWIYSSRFNGGVIWVMMLFSTDKEHWFKNRDAYMRGARGCVTSLVNPAGHWRLSRDSESVKKSALYWVKRAKRCHRIAMGFEPITHVSHDGSLYAPIFVGDIV